MSRRVLLDVINVLCSSDHGNEACDGHKIRLVHHITSDTVNLQVDNEHYTFDEVIWGKIIQAEIEDDEKLKERHTNGIQVDQHKDK